MRQVYECVVTSLACDAGNLLLHLVTSETWQTPVSPAYLYICSYCQPVASYA